MRNMPIPIPKVVGQRAIANVTKLPDGCWQSDYRTMTNGYRQISNRDPETKKDKVYLAHRAAYTLANGPIPEGLVIDHLCFNRACVNPDHLRAISLADNTRRRNGAAFPLGECKYGHPLTAQRQYNRLGRPQFCCGACMDETNLYRTQIKVLVRRLEIALGIGEWGAMGRHYTKTVDELAARARAIRESPEFQDAA